MTGVDEIMTLETTDIETVLNKHGERLDKHDDQIYELSISQAKTNEKLNSLESQLTRFENNSYQTNAAVLSTMTQIVMNTASNNVEIIKSKNESETEIVKTKDNNKTKIIIKILGIITILVAGVFIGNKVNFGSIISNILG